MERRQSMPLVEIPLCSPSGFPTPKPKVERLRLRDFELSRRHILAAIGLAALFVSVGVFVGLILTRLLGGPLVEDAEFLNQDVNWQRSCESKCSATFDVPPLLLISLDGFRVEYLSRDLTPAIARVHSCGVRSYMFPTFPSKTFPNHLSIVTGLYPESHGIVGSHFVDFNIPQQHFTPKTRDPVWFSGEPIWNTAHSNGKRSATFFWPGSEVHINGNKPTFAVNFNSSIPFSQRVDQVGSVESRGKRIVTNDHCQSILGGESSAAAAAMSVARFFASLSLLWNPQMIPHPRLRTAE